MENNGNFDWAEYTRLYRQRHPEKRLQWRVTAAVNLLKRQGYIVIPPQETAAPARDGEHE